MVMPIVGAIQWIVGFAVQAKRKRPMGGPKEANIAGTRRCSCARKPRFMMSGMR